MPAKPLPQPLPVLSPSPAEASLPTSDAVRADASAAPPATDAPPAADAPLAAVAPLATDAAVEATATAAAVRRASQEPPTVATAGREDLDATLPVVRLEVVGMHCAGCVGRAEKALQSVGGVVSASVQLASETGVVRSAAGAPPPTTELLAALARVGLEGKILSETGPTALNGAAEKGAAEEGAAADGSAPPETKSRTTRFADGLAAWGRVHARRAAEARAWKLRFRLAIALLVPTAWIYLFPWGAPVAEAVVAGSLALIGQVVIGGAFYKRAWEAARGGAATMDTLVSLGATAALCSGFAEAWLATAGHALHAGGGHSPTMAFLDGLVILAFVSLGRSWEAAAKGETTAAMAELTALFPRSAVRRRNGRVEAVPAEELQVGDEAVVAPGETIPADGVVLDGASTLSQAWLTGEAMPVPCNPGDLVHAGAVNGPQSLGVRVERPAGAALLAQLVDRVREAQESRPAIQRLVDRVVGRFVPAVLGIAFVTLFAWGFIGDDWRQGWRCLTAVLVVACPCALGLATPTAVLVASGTAARKGIFVQRAEHFEALAEVRTVLFDKTGTLTQGEPEVVSAAPAIPVSAAPAVPDAEGGRRLWSLAAAAEAASRHPFAAAVLKGAAARSISYVAGTELEIVPGEGIVVRTASGRVAVGNEALLQREGAAVSDSAAWGVDRAAGSAPLGVSCDGLYLGRLTLADPLHPESAAAVRELLSLGLRVEMVSGDHADAAARAARLLGIEHVSAGVHPQDKERIVRERQATFGKTAMVGDGVNDAAALAAADAGLAMGQGTASATLSAGMVLTRRDPRLVAAAVRLSRRTARIIRENLGWAFGYNVLLVPAASGALLPLFGVWLPPSLSAAAMALSSVSVVLNSLRLRAE